MNKELEKKSQEAGVIGVCKGLKKKNKLLVFPLKKKTQCGWLRKKSFLSFFVLVSEKKSLSDVPCCFVEIEKADRGPEKKTPVLGRKKKNNVAGEKKESRRRVVEKKSPCWLR